MIPLWNQTDKLQHAGIGLLVAYLHFVGWHDLAYCGYFTSWLIAVACTTAIGILKELGDKFGGYGGDCEVLDAVATTAGALVGASMGVLGSIL